MGSTPQISFTFAFEITKNVKIFTFSLFSNFYTLLYFTLLNHYKLFILTKLLLCHSNPLIIIL